MSMNLVSLKVDFERFPMCKLTNFYDRKQAAKFLGVSQSIVTRDAQTLDLPEHTPLRIDELYAVWCFRSYLLGHPRCDRAQLARGLRDGRSKKRIQRELLDSGYSPEAFLTQLEEWLQTSKTTIKLSRTEPYNLQQYRRRKATEHCNTISRRTAAQLLSCSPATVGRMAKIAKFPAGRQRLTLRQFTDLFCVRCTMDLIQQVEKRRVFIEEIEDRFKKVEDDTRHYFRMSDRLGYTNAHAKAIFNAALQGQIQPVRFDLQGIAAVSAA